MVHGWLPSFTIATSEEIVSRKDSSPVLEVMSWVMVWNIINSFRPAHWFKVSFLGTMVTGSVSRWTLLSGCVGDRPHWQQCSYSECCCTACFTDSSVHQGFIAVALLTWYLVALPLLQVSGFVEGINGFVSGYRSMSTSYGSLLHFYSFAVMRSIYSFLQV